MTCANEPLQRKMTKHFFFYIFVGEHIKVGSGGCGEGAGLLLR